MEIKIETAQTLTGFDGREAMLECAYSGAEKTLSASNIVMVTARSPNDALYHAVKAEAGKEALPFNLTRIGDCDAPGIIAAAVYAGHRYAQELDASVDIDMPMRHDRIDVGLDRYAPDLQRKEAAE